jgi:hypothetical protein
MRCHGSPVTGTASDREVGNTDVTLRDGSPVERIHQNGARGCLSSVPSSVTNMEDSGPGKGRPSLPSGGQAAINSSGSPAGGKRRHGDVLTGMVAGFGTGL